MPKRSLKWQLKRDLMICVGLSSRNKGKLTQWPTRWRCLSTQISWGWRFRKTSKAGIVLNSILSSTKWTAWASSTTKPRGNSMSSKCNWTPKDMSLRRRSRKWRKRQEKKAASSWSRIKPCKPRQMTRKTVSWFDSCAVTSTLTRGKSRSSWQRQRSCAAIVTLSSLRRMRCLFNSRKTLKMREARSATSNLS